MRREQVASLAHRGPEIQMAVACFFDLPVYCGRMSFRNGRGTRGARQPRGRFLLWANRLMIRRVRTGGRFLGGMDGLVLTTVGRRSGIERQSPVSWFPGPDGSRLVVASAGGAPGNPAWFHNLAANPDRVRVEVGGETFDVTADQLHGDEREEAWRQITAAAPRFEAYQRKTDREIPVIRLTPRAG
jgi:deazaflavin-dependent oxidoreductase (nitroreductase family)